MKRREMSDKKPAQSRYLGLAVLVIIFCAGLLTSGLNAQNLDTLRVLNVSGDAGDTVSLFINLANHSDSIGGFIIRLSYNANALDPVNVLPTSRYNWSNFNPDLGDDGIVRVLAYMFIGEHPIPIGNGPIAEIRFRIMPGAPNGNSPINFATVDPNQDNTLSNWFGSRLIFPQLVNGFVNVSGGIDNDPPELAPLNSPLYVNEGGQIQFTVSATDVDDDLIRLTAANLPVNSTWSNAQGFGEVQSTFRFNPVVGQGPDTFIVTFSVTDDINLPAEASVTIFLLTGSSNRAPLFSPLGAQVVAEGDHLEFVVSAHDPDGDIITLDAPTLPAHAQFAVAQGDSVASSTFYFDPDYTQGPDTIFVNFRASDNFNNVTQMAVQIIILDAPNDFLEVIPHQGALPGALGRNLAISLRNSLPIYGLQFDLLYDPAILEMIDVLPDSARTFDLAFFSELMEEGRYRIVIFSLGMETIASGSGKIVDFVMDIDGDALPGSTEIMFDSAYSVQDSAGTSKDIIYLSSFYTIDILGDANLDGLVTVGDCVAVIASLLGRITLDIRGFDAADVNRDGDVRISDLMLIVNAILGRTIIGPPLLDHAGSVELIRQDLAPGFQGEIPLWLELNTEAAGVQFTITYDPSQVLVHDIRPGAMIDGLRLDFNDTGNEIHAAVYDFDLSEFGPTIGELADLDVEFLDPDADPSRALRLTDFEIVTVNAQTLNVDVLGELPESYTLNQNYPNPFNARTSISFSIPVSTFVRVGIYNVLGQYVKELFAGRLEAGSHHLIWDGASADGESVTSGVYFYRLQAEDFDKTKKMLLVK